VNPTKENATQPARAALDLQHLTATVVSRTQSLQSASLAVVHVPLDSVPSAVETTLVNAVHYVMDVPDQMPTNVLTAFATPYVRLMALVLVRLAIPEIVVKTIPELVITSVKVVAPTDHAAVPAVLPTLIAKATTVYAIDFGQEMTVQSTPEAVMIVAMDASDLTTHIVINALTNTYSLAMVLASVWLAEEDMLANSGLAHATQPA